MKKVLVTGASGQLGLTIQDIHKKYENLKFVFKDSNKLDITNLNAIQKIFTNGNFDYCINCAAYTNVEQSEKTPEIAFKINAKGVENLALACKNENVVLIHISTDYVFDGEKLEPYTINDIPNPINEYGKSKLEGEKYIQKILNDYYIIRTSWLYSKIHGHNFYKTILKKAKTGEQIKVTDEQTGCPTDSVNLATFIINQIESKNKLFGIYHYSDDKQMTWFDFAKTIINSYNLNASQLLVLDRNYRTFAKRPVFSILKN
ncbi:dTDP-4-dehydrorhamnose reductase [Cellulophaga baltica]|uniref:dTDP-4-dehydrorhamnose reductase n=1 Tax=Cellulophaga TaxID=104264 RepID=UPI001C07B897|nr:MULTISPECIES: dTDP-4-dehydrorhamnose reductase [Cellulophaga]MBU2995983.1 dTDP-4-dehydrorhamnose reductase [Cellulophaga baltica]MDO6767378.1 dTDP-4-dehydrorhamnose reductase [Cellulophaga sp. 1_MG-2023]